MSDGDGSVANGPSTITNRQSQPHPRSASTSIPERRPGGNSRSNILDTKNVRQGQHHRTASSSHHLAPPHVPGTLSATSIGHGSSPHTAKDTFLNYFFGGPNGPNGTIPQTQSQQQQAHSHSAPGSSDGRTERRAGSKQPPSGFIAKELLPDLASGRRQSSRGGGGGNLDMATTAYDMKSLGKHLDAVSNLL